LFSLSFLYPSYFLDHLHIDKWSVGWIMGTYIAGIDLGTTNLELILVDLENFRITERYSAPVRRIPSGNPYAFEQDAVSIVASVRELLGKVKTPFSSVGITGQVHGIVYTGEDLRALSPFYCWLDRRGAEPWNNTTPQAALEEKTGFRLPVGYGLLTHYANRLFGRVPQAARRLMGITELVAGNLTGAPLSKTDDSILASFGGWEPVGGYREALLAEALSPGYPAFLEAAPHFSVAGNLVGGFCPGDGAPVAYPVGDNQAGFFGALSRPEEACLISIGTSGQISFFSKNAVCPPGMELRPYLGKGYIQVGATLTAGKSYEALASLIKEIIRASGNRIEDEAVFTLMKQAATSGGETSLVFETTLNGTRRDTAKRGTITGIGLDNFTLDGLVLSAVDGIVRELADFTKQSGVSFDGVKYVAVTGNAPRKNDLFLKAIRRQFNQEVRVPDFDGAGLGAAIIGAVAAGLIKDGETAGVIEQFQANAKHNR
jgi:sedoheptulokinase